MTRKIMIFILIIFILTNPVAAEKQKNSADLIEIELGGENYLVENYDAFTANYAQLHRPVVGIALSGGGARAMVNFGVIKALREEGIPIDFLTGTSMGAIVSVLYGSGLNTDQILEVVTTTSFGRLIDLGIGGRTGSLLDTKKLNLFLEEISPNKKLEKFEIPAALLSFELTEGKKYLTTTGRISEVVQSSYSIPIYFPVEQKGGRYFMDAGILEATPAKAAAVLGADFVIATTSAPKQNKENLESAGASIDRFLNILQDNYSQQIINNYADFLIDINVDDYSFMDFNQAKELVELGYEKTKKKIPALKKELEIQKIGTFNYSKREKYKIKDTFSDLKNNRFIVDSSGYNLFLNYGRDQSYFDQELIVPFVDNFQTGIEFKADNLSLDIKGDDFFDEGYEAKFEFKKMTQKTDLMAVYANDYQHQSKSAYRLELKYFADDFQSAIGYGRENDEEYYLLNAQYFNSTKASGIDSENDIIYNKKKSELGILSSNIFKFNLGSKWNLKSQFVFNNTEILNSPLIYRGQELDFNNEFQTSIDFKYSYHFIDPIYFAGFFQTTNIGTYLFFDYYENDNNSGKTAGIGLDSQLYLLGLSPIALDLYFAYDFEEEDDRVGLELGYEF